MAHTRQGIRELTREEIAAVSGASGSSSWSLPGPFGKLWQAVCIAEQIFFCLTRSRNG